MNGQMNHTSHHGHHTTTHHGMSAAAGSSGQQHGQVVQQQIVVEEERPPQPSLAHIPLKSYMIKDFPFHINCKGCNKSFPCYYTPKGFKKIPAPAYYVHCIDDCAEYQSQESDS